MKTKLLFLLALISISLICCNKQMSDAAQTATEIITESTEVESNDFIESLLAKMTVEEKVGQMTQYTGFFDPTGPVPKDSGQKEKYEAVKSGKVGSMLNVKTVKDVRALQKLAVENSRLGIPLIFGFDVIHGHKIAAPIPLAESASWDLEAIKKSAANAAKEASAVGINWTFAPMVDIGRDARWGRVMEGGGEDPYLGSKIATARVKGFQGDDLSDPTTIAACAKHFAGYGYTEDGRDYNTTDFGISTMYNVVLPPFKAAVDAGVQTFMNGFNDWNGIPVTGNEWLQRDILKGQWGFDGFVVSDWGSIGEMVAHGYAEDNEHAAELAVVAGSDMDMEAYAYQNFLPALVDSNVVDMALLDDAVRRILTVKQRLGLFDDPYLYCDEEREAAMAVSQEVKDDALDIAKKSIVLLKNDDILPLSKSATRVAVIGQLAESKNAALGSWRLGVEDNTAVSVIEGLEPYLGKNMTYQRGVEVYNGTEGFVNELNINFDDESGIREAVSLARSSDIVIVVAGEHGYQSGEGRSRTDIRLPGLQREMLKQLKEANENIVLVVTSGRPLELSWEDENIPAIVQAWQLGTRAGDAIAEVLFGDYNPSGKLPMTFPRNVGQVPAYYGVKSTGRGDAIDLVFWSHYSDMPNSPLYPFGYGLSYTTYEYSKPTITPTPSGASVSVIVTNTGDVDGEEVVQLYIRDKAASVTRPVKELKGFEKVAIKAGGSQTVTFTLGSEELGFFNNDGEYLVEPGEFDVMVGPNCMDTEGGSFILK